jgi:cobalt-zinc-cadmium efflux system outer membrane protein
MKNSYARILSFILLLFFTFSRCETVLASGLNINQFIQIAIENNKDLQAVKYDISLAKGRLVQAGQWLNPSLNLGNSDDRLFRREGDYTRSVGFSQQFPIAGRIGQQKKVAQVDVAIAIAEIKEAERKLAGEVANSFYGLLITQRRLQQVKHLLPINEKLIRVTHNRLHAAEVSELDANTARLEYQRLLQEKSVLESQQINQLAHLNELLGRPSSSSLLLDEHLPSLVQLPSLIDIQKLALHNRADFQIAWLNLHRAQADIALARAERWSDWTVGLGVDQNKQVVEGAPPQNSNRALNLTLTIPLPLLNTNKGRILEAGAAEIKADAKIQAAQLSIETEVASSYEQVALLQNILKQSQSTSLSLSMRNIHLAQNAYSAGQISLFEVVQAQRQQNDLQMAYLNTLDQYLQAFVKLCSAIGSDRTGMCSHLSRNE